VAFAHIEVMGLDQSHFHILKQIIKLLNELQFKDTMALAPALFGIEAGGSDVFGEIGKANDFTSLLIDHYYEIFEMNPYRDRYIRVVGD